MLESQLSRMFSAATAGKVQIGAVIDPLRKMQLEGELKQEILSVFPKTPCFFVGMVEAMPKTPPVDRRLIHLPFRKVIFEFKRDSAKSKFLTDNQAELSIFLICEEVVPGEHDWAGEQAGIIVKPIEYFRCKKSGNLFEGSGGESVGWNGVSTFIGFNDMDEFVGRHYIKPEIAKDNPFVEEYMKSFSTRFNEDILNALYTALALFACKNVVQRIIRPPEKLQKAREKRGKAPLLTYRVLKLDMPQTADEDIEEETDSDRPKGTHASPRFHLRRGHFRRIPCHHNGEHPYDLTWVSPCTVGRKELGQVVKDYTLIFE